MVISNQEIQPVTPSNVNDCFLVLELSGDDPLFDKKKKLLEDKGFVLHDRVEFNEALEPEIEDAKLAKLLQRARIFHLNDVELYFGPMNMDPPRPEEFYSPRNELEALNFILSRIEHNSEKSKGNNASLKYLRDAIIKRVYNLGDIHKLETRLVDATCVNETLFMQWAQTYGVKSKLQIAYFEGTGRGALAAEDLEVGDIALEIPISVVISEDLVYESDMVHKLKNIEGISAETMLLLWSMRERHNFQSKYKVYFDSLPEKFNTGLSFSLDAMITLHETLVFEEISQAKEHLRSTYEELFPALSISYPDIFSPQYYSWEQYLWACELWYSNSMKIMFPDGKLKTCLIPVAGFLNHSVCPHILNYGRVDSASKTLKFPLSRPCKRGEQCYLSYGNLSNSHLLTFYGFLPQEMNPFDIIPLDIVEAPECSSKDGYLACDTTTYMVRGTWLSVNHDIFYYGLPSPLLDHLRRVGNPCVQTMTLSKENLENERKIIEDLFAIFDSMMEKLGDSELEDRKNKKLDVQLAIEYKDRQRNVVSSLLTACYKGRKMLEAELEKLDG
ncbi:uncharacterized protein LOC130814683 isoform X1 [Amaranthus tricolor]|uniref:uncharacterized protein LOC130814683 isoform X1 n=1 Tax=Amaranthus tricolor TaxID=29722 RepID=UPI002584FC76|nr:uncharacterized protein LOC130814683 isoform X1 [Amaranthus tricolor]